MRRDAVLIAEMIEAAERILALVGDLSPAALDADRERREALLWNFTVLGEAASQVSDSLRESYPAIPWGDPVRLRNRIVHGYWSIDLGVLVATAQDDLEPMLTALRALGSELETEPE